MAVRLEEPPEWSRLLEEALTLPGRMSSVYTRFWPYSLGNQILLWMQGVTEPVATFNRWKEMRRQVKRGSKAKAILRPITVKLKDKVDDEGKPVQMTRFKLVNCLFAVSDTEGDDLPPYEPPEWSEERALSALDIERVPFESLDGNVQGWSYKRTVAINPVAGWPFKTLIHELGHVVLGHTTMAGEIDFHKGVREFQAEATAYLVLNDLGATDQMDAAGSRHYIQTWLKGQRPPDNSIREVFKAADAILRAGRPVTEAVPS